ncbi:MAG: hypothetical protein KAT75_00615 [Dehalococcoidia bacterium]|nr:hypothetical protein [Dehalococcoidia bacterium]
MPDGKVLALSEDDILLTPVEGANSDRRLLPEPVLIAVPLDVCPGCASGPCLVL